MRNYGETAMKTVRVDKATLIKKLKENAEKHRKEFTEAMDGYWRSFNSAITGLAVQVKNRDLSASHAIQLERPVDHSEEYNRAIQMLLWEVEDTVTLSINDFNCYVLDDWDWQGNFKYLHSNYTSAA